MGKDSRIEWTHHTFNPWMGCTKVSEGCRNCYAETLMADRYKKVKWGPGAPRQRTTPSYWRQPLKWDREAAAAGERRRVFCASLADVFDEGVDDAWRYDLFALIALTKHLDWLLLTKRPEVMERWIKGADFGRINDAARAISKRDDIAVLPTQRHGMVPGGWPLENVWLGVSVENQATADLRIFLLLDTPAVVRFVSYEPAIGPVDFDLFFAFDEEKDYGGSIGSFPHPGVDWIIVGGESGHGARPLHEDWVRNTVQQCQDEDVPVFVKQMGRIVLTGPTATVGTTSATQAERLRDPKGGDPAEWPEDLRVRQFPNPKPIGV